LLDFIKQLPQQKEKKTNGRESCLDEMGCKSANENRHHFPFAIRGNFFVIGDAKNTPKVKTNCHSCFTYLFFRCHYKEVSGGGVFDHFFVFVL